MCLKNQNFLNQKILVVDNASTDDTISLITEHLKDIEVFVCKDNKGYAAGINIAIDWAIKKEAKYLFILNPDITLDSKVLLTLVEKAKIYDSAGAFGPSIIQISWGDHISNTSEDDKEVNWISGCALFLRVKAIKNVGYFDEDYFLYFEETDYLYRMKNKGWKIMTVDSAKIIHYGSASSKQMKTRSYFYLIRNIFLFTKKNILQKEGTQKAFKFIITNLYELIYFPIHPLRLCAYIAGIIAGLFLLIQPSKPSPPLPPVPGGRGVAWAVAAVAGGPQGSVGPVEPRTGQ